MPIITKPFSIREMKTPAELAEAMRKLNLDIPIGDDLSPLSRRVALGKRTLANSVAINPMEGADARINGEPGEPAFRKYGRLAAAGPGIYWFEACAICEDGRGGPHQFFINRDSIGGFAKLTAHVDKVCRDRHGYAPYKVLQFSHAGRSSHDLHGEPKPLSVCANPYLDKYTPNLKIVTDEYVDRLIEKAADAAILAMEAGFDAVDLKLCHDFLLREFLSAYTRPGRYGGSFENRTRFYFSCIDRIRARTGGRIDIAVRINAYDSMPYPYGWGMDQTGVMREDLAEPIRLIRMLANTGIRLFSISTMFPRYAPRGAGYPANFAPDAKVMPYEGASLLLEVTRRIKRMVPGAVIVSAGLSWFEQFAANVGAGGICQGWFDIAGYGRQALASPDFIESILAGRIPAPETACRTCDSCFRCLELGWPAGCAAHDPLYRTLLRIAVAQKGKE